MAHLEGALEEGKGVPVARGVKVEPRDPHQVNPQRVALKVGPEDSGASNPSAELRGDQ